MTARVCPQAGDSAGAAPQSPIPNPQSRLRYALLTFGCRVNQADSFEIESALRARGAAEASPATADLVVVNTCTVTAASDQGVRQAIRRIAGDNPCVQILVTGCYATRRPDDLAALPNVVCLVPNEAKESIGAWLDDTFGTATAGPGNDGDGPCGHTLEPGALGRTLIPLRVQTGCDEACSFCVIPSTRGASRSKPLDDVVGEARRLAGSGYKEIWLVGVHLGAYGRDLPERLSLLELARALDTLDGDVTFRLSSLEPMDCTAELVDLVASSSRFAPHFHLPLQHASDRLLMAMRRPYTAAFCESLIGRIVDRLPHASVGADVIAGFPGETDADVEIMAQALERMPLASLHVFPYSDRPGTGASALRPKVGGADIRARAAQMRAIGARHAARFAERQVGAVRPGLTLDDGTVVLTDNYVKVRVPPGLARNTRVRVRIDEAEPALRGRVAVTDT